MGTESPLSDDELDVSVGASKNVKPKPVKLKRAKK
jgi:hypothetical protein